MVMALRMRTSTHQSFYLFIFYLVIKTPHGNEANCVVLTQLIKEYMKSNHMTVNVLNHLTVCSIYVVYVLS